MKLHHHTWGRGVLNSPGSFRSYFHGCRTNCYDLQPRLPPRNSSHPFSQYVVLFATRLRREMVENHISIGYEDGCRIGGGCTAYIIWILYGINTSSPDYPTIVGGAVGIIGAVLQFILILTVGEKVFGGNMEENHENREERTPKNYENREERTPENHENREKRCSGNMEGGCLKTPKTPKTRGSFELKCF